MPRLSKRLQQSYEELVQFLRTGPRLGEIEHALAEQLTDALSLEAMALLYTDPVTFLATDAHTVGFDPAAGLEFQQHIYLKNELRSFLDIREQKESVSLLSAYTGGDLALEGRYRDFYRPRGFRHEMRSPLHTGEAYWGGLCVIRGDDSRDFSAGEQTFLSMIAPRVAEALRLERRRQSAAQEGRGQILTLLLDARNRILFRSQQAEAVLERFTTSEPSSPETLPWPLHSVVSLLQTQRQKGDGAGQSPEFTIQDRTGGWWTLHAVLPEAGAEGSLNTVLIMTPARPEERFPRLMAAYDLAPREREMVDLIAAGLSTKEIAGRLYLSEYTVMDYVKRIFAKMNVSSRRELMALLFHQGSPVRLIRYSS